MIKLSADQKATFEWQLRTTREVNERNRLCVILGHNDGLSIDNLAKALRLSRATVCSYLDDFNSQQKTKNDPRGGLEPKLSEDQSQALSKHLGEVTYLKVKHICGYVQKTFGVTYSRSGITAWLQSHGFVFKRPKKVPGRVDPQQQELFIKKYEELKASKKPDEEIYFLEAVHPEHQSQAVCGWIKKGLQKTLQTTGKQLRLHIVGAICLQGNKICTREYESVDGDAMVDFLKHLETFSKAPRIHVILDNAKAHKNKKIDELIKTSKIELHYLPPYSPNLNPIERLWKMLREAKLYNRFYDSAAACFQAIRGFFKDDIPRLAEKLRSRINDDFQVVKLNPIRLAE